MRRLAVLGGSDVAAASEQQPVQSLQRCRHVGRGVEDTDLAANVQHRLPIIFELAPIRDANQRHSGRSCYIRAGTSMPIKPSARVTSSRTYATAPAAQRFKSPRPSLRTGYR